MNGVAWRGGGVEGGGEGVVVAVVIGRDGVVERWVYGDTIGDDGSGDEGENRRLWNGAAGAAER